MKSQNRVWLFAAAAFCAAASFAEDTTTGSGSAAALPIAPAASSSTTVGVPAATVYGNFDFRPSWTTKKGSFGTESTVELGAKLGKSTYLTYANDIYTNMYDPKKDAEVYDLRARLGGGMFRARVNNIAGNADNGVAFSYENRLYVPVLKVDRANGFIATMRNYFKFSKNITKSFNLNVQEVAIVHAYNRAESSGAALPLVENREYVIATYYITEKLMFSVPILFHQTKHQTATGAAASGEWSHYLWTWPEIDYYISPTLYVGLALYSDNLVQPQLRKMNIKEGLEKGVFQVVANMTL